MQYSEVPVSPLQGNDSAFFFCFSFNINSFLIRFIVVLIVIDYLGQDSLNCCEGLVFHRVDVLRCYL